MPNEFDGFAAAFGEAAVQTIKDPSTDASCLSCAQAPIAVGYPYPHLVLLNNKDTNYFIAICKYGPHSFTLIGLQDSNGNNYILCALGKVANSIPGKCTIAKLYSKAICGDLESSLKDETARNGTLFTGNQRDVSYKCFDITKEEAQEYQKIAQSYTGFNYYEHESATTKGVAKIKLNYALQLNAAAPKPTPLNANPTTLSPTNSCRHNAREMVSRTLQRDDLGISTLFFRDLPCQGTIEEGMISAKYGLFTLPTPPDTALKKTNRQAYEGLATVYGLLENIAESAADEHALKKFKAVKLLYSQLIATSAPSANSSSANNAPDMAQTLNNITKWEQENQTIIDYRRRSKGMCNGLLSCVTMPLATMFKIHTSTRDVVTQLKHSYAAAPRKFK